MMKALIVKPHWGNLILDGEKVWEIRGSNTTIRGEVGIIFSGSGEVKGSVFLADSLSLTKEEFEQNKDLHRIACSYEELPYKHPYRWVLKSGKRYKKPKPYKHPQGAVIWVNLS